MSIVNNIKYILIHCSDISHKVSADQFNSINNYHRDERGFPRSSLGFYVGYHYLITGDKEYRCRLDTDEGAHCNQGYDGTTVYAPATYDNTKIKSMNHQSVGVCIGFDGDIEYPTAMQYALLQKRVWALQDKWGVSNENVRFHREFAKSKTCPGSLITQAWLDELLKRPVPVVVPPKPIESMCVVPVVQEVKKPFSWYDLYSKFLAWATRGW
jgi:hypothetical protein